MYGYGVELPPHVFFTPNSYFWRMVSAIYASGVKLTDCGAGLGVVVDEAHRRGLDMRGLDISYREGQSARIESTCAMSVRWTPESWPMLCRPSHGHWVFSVFDKAREARSCGIYVGLKKNVPGDLGGLFCKRVSWRPVGAEGEHMYLVWGRNSPNRRAVLGALFKVRPFSEEEKIAA